MIKSRELSDPNSCMSRAKDHEMTFVLLARDKAAPVAIRAWVAERIRLGKNIGHDPQIEEALSCAKSMEEQSDTVPSKAAEAVVPLQTPPIPGEVFEALAKFQAAAERISGAELLAAEAPGRRGHPSIVAIAENTRLRIYDLWLKLKKDFGQASSQGFVRDAIVRGLEAYAKAAPAAPSERGDQCELCKHSLVNNLHGFDQNDAWMDGDNLVHSGRCTYCKLCRAGLSSQEGK